MKVYNDISEIDFNINRAITVGSFDGIHLGHMKLLGTLISKAKKKGLSTFVVTFDTHPQIFLRPEHKKQFPILTTKVEKLSVLELIGIDEVFVVKFNEDFASMSSYKFATTFLLKNIGFKLIVIGDNHGFGKNREGNFSMLQRLSTEFSIHNQPLFEVINVPPFVQNGIVISSTFIRQVMVYHSIEYVNKLLGYNYFLMGYVRHGDNIGHTLGFPTANIETIDNKLYPKNGVYICTVDILGKQYSGVANIGYRPTMFDTKSEESNTVFLKPKPNIEVYILDFSGDIYDMKINISFMQYLREEVKFENRDKLIDQIETDITNCRKYFNTLNWKNN
jgi:riboflavin kinase/FMN adenylyltransferase